MKAKNKDLMIYKSLFIIIVRRIIEPLPWMQSADAADHHWLNSALPSQHHGMLQAGFLLHSFPHQTPDNQSQASRFLLKISLTHDMGLIKLT